jgi:N-methylhydantoinase A
MLLGVDTGGTFTDFVLFDGARLRVHKVLSTPAAPEAAILAGVSELGAALPGLQVIHGSTVATNAVLEGKGVKTAFITNHGLADLLTIGRQARAELYDLQPAPVAPPVPRELCLTVGGRVGADGGLVEPFAPGELQTLTGRLQALGPRAVAINLLFSFLDSAPERAVEAAVPEGMFVSRSSAVLPEYREYERGVATWLNAYVGPLMAGYLERLAAGLRPAKVAVMQSSGQTMEGAGAARFGVHMLLSGPAGGLMGAAFVGRVAGCDRLLTFDMGGTSTDVALVDGDVRLTSEGHIGRYPVAVPMVDMHTIGAGGGSIARIDAGGALQVGPESAGADPGPACYGRGGIHPTVTDANLVLGRLRADAFLGGAMGLDGAAARRAVARVAGPMGLGLEEAAAGIVRLADEHMANALRVISVQRGIDPRGFTLLSFGGAGGLHACALAETLRMDRVLVPVHAGVLSALGMLAAPRGRQLSRTVNGVLPDFAERDLDREFLTLEEAGRRALAAEGVTRTTSERRVDLRYLGQSYTLEIPWQGTALTPAAFHEAHERRYGHGFDEPVELVNLRVQVRGPQPDLALTPLAPRKGGAPPVAQRMALFGAEGPVPVYRRAELLADDTLAGPALVTETVASTFVASGWRCRVDPWGNLHLER